MAIDSVSSNTTLYTGLGAVAGAGIGAAAGFSSTPFIKKGEPTDKFMREFLIQDAKLYQPECEEDKIFQDICLNPYKIDKIKNKEELDKITDLFSNADRCENLCAETKRTFRNEGLEKAKKTLKNGITDLMNEFIEIFKEDFKHCWDAKAKAFKTNVDFGINSNLSNRDIPAFQKAAKVIKNRYTAVCAGIGAAVLGTVGFLLGNHLKNLDK